MLKALHPNLLSLVTSAKDSQPDWPALFDAFIESQSPSWALAAFDKAGLLDAMFPELAACRNVLQNPYHHLPVFEHILLSMGHIEQIADSPENYFSDLAVSDPIRANRKDLILAALGHDLGKPDSQKEREPGYFTFYYHEKKSVSIYKKIANRFCRDDQETKAVTKLIDDHMIAANLASLYARKITGQKAIRRFLERHQDTWPLLLGLGLADCLATRGPKADPKLLKQVIDFEKVLIETQKSQNQVKEKILPLDGKDLMKAFNLSPGPEIGRLLQLAESIVEANPDISKDALIGLIKNKKGDTL